MLVSSHELSLPRRFLRRIPRGAPRERVYAIGDIHGRADLLGELLAGILRDCTIRPAGQRKIRLVFLGDFVDRGPSSKLLVELLHHASRSGIATVLTGNHEQALLDCAAGLIDPREAWLRFGGSATLASFGVQEPRENESREQFGERLSAAIGESSLTWLRSLPLFWRSGDFYFCHAGVKPGRALAKQRPRDLLWIRDEFLESRRHHGAIIVHGHSVTSEITIRHNRVGIDTGAYRTGRLTALAIEDDLVWYLTTEPEASNA